MSEVVSADDADRDFGVTFRKEEERAGLVGFRPEDIAQQQSGVGT